jgi:hypothetical protein
LIDIPDQPADGYTERTDNGTCVTGEDTVTVTVYRTPFTWVLENGQWVKSEGTEVVFSTSERELDEEETESCQPDGYQDDVTETIGDPVCGDLVVATRTTVTNFIYSYVNGEWVAVGGTPQISFGERDLTAQELLVLLQSCVPEREPEETRKDVGDPECGDTTMAVEVTTTTFTYEFEDGEWVETPVQHVEVVTRPLNQEELDMLDEECDVVPNLTSVTPTGPEVIPPTCAAPGDYKVRGLSGVAKEAGITYVVYLSTDSADEPGTIVIEASAEAGSVIPEGVKKTWKINPSQIARLTGEQCATSSATTSTEPAAVSAALPPSQPAQAAIPAATTTVAPPTQSLPVTGGSPWTTLWIALAALGAGGLVVRLSRRSAS